MRWVTRTTLAHKIKTNFSNYNILRILFKITLRENAVHPGIQLPKGISIKHLMWHATPNSIKLNHSQYLQNKTQ